MTSFIPVGSLKRDEIYSFIGGFFITCAWYVYYLHAKQNSIASGIEAVANPAFLLSWLSATAILFVLESIISFVVIKAITRWMKYKTQLEKKRLLGMSDPVEDFVWSEYLAELKTSVHLLSIIIIAAPLSFSPIYRLASPLLPRATIGFSIVLFIVIYIVVLFFLIKLWTMFLAINSLRTDGLLDVIDEKSYSEVRAHYLANLRNDRSKRMLEIHFTQQNAAR